MSPSASSRPPRGGPWPRVVVVGHAAGRRVGLLQGALARLGAPAAEVVSYPDLLAGRARLESIVTEGSVLRIESPDRDFDAERALLAAGAAAAAEEGDPNRIGPEEALRLEFDRGRIVAPRQWYLGFRAALDRIARQRAACPPHVAMNDPDDIATMFDKRLCHALFDASGVPCPRGVGSPAGYDDLRDRMRRAGMRRVFVKLAHGSSASGVVALETDGRRVQAFTTVEVVSASGGPRLYNTRAIRRLTDERDAASVIDALAPEGLHAEQWVPKASLPGGSFDLRVLVIAGRAAHRVARVSRSPMTNLHLLNRRGDPEDVRARMAPDAWDAALRSCERAASLFPHSLYAGVDLLIASGFRRHVVIEINAFGDLLPDLASGGLDTYSAELVALRERAAEAP